MKLKELKRKLMKKPGFARAYYEGQWEIGLISSHALIVARISKGWTQEKLAKKAGTTQSNVARAEMGSHIPSLKTMNSLAKAMGMVVEIKLVPKKTIKQLREEV